MQSSRRDHATDSERTTLALHYAYSSLTIQIIIYMLIKNVHTGNKRKITVRGPAFSIFLLLSGRPKRPHYGSGSPSVRSSVRLSVPYRLLTRKQRGVEKPTLVRTFSIAGVTSCADLGGRSHNMSSLDRPIYF